MYVAGVASAPGAEPVRQEARLQAEPTDEPAAGDGRVHLKAEPANDTACVCVAGFDIPKSAVASALFSVLCRYSFSKSSID